MIYNNIYYNYSYNIEIYIIIDILHIYSVYSTTSFFSFRKFKKKKGGTIANHMIDVKDFLSVTRDIIEQQIRDRSTDAVCEIESVNEDGTLNVFVLPDKQTILKNIINESRYNFKRGDNALLYKIHNRLSDSFVVAKFRPKQEDAGISEKSVQNLIDNALQNYQGGSGGGVSGGIQGPPGPQGVQGEIGPTGPTGAAGEAGSIGPTGPAGSTGANGADGSVGPTGPRGAVGPTGERGEIGPTGERGPAGASGSSSGGGVSDVLNPVGCISFYSYDSAFSVTPNYDGNVSSLSYSVDLGKTWTDIEASGTSIASSTVLPESETNNIINYILFRGLGNSVITGENSIPWTITDTTAIFCTGDINTLLDYQYPPDTITEPYCFANMFLNQTSLVSAPRLPSIEISDYCYYKMFQGCTSLTLSPDLPARKVPDSAYEQMFMGCEQLTTPPQINGRSFNSRSCFEMFNGDTNLNRVPEMLIIESSANSFENMFVGASGLEVYESSSFTINQTDSVLICDTKDSGNFTYASLTGYSSSIYRYYVEKQPTSTQFTGADSAILTEYIITHSILDSQNN